MACDNTAEFEIIHEGGAAIDLQSVGVFGAPSGFTYSAPVSFTPSGLIEFTNVSITDYKQYGSFMLEVVINGEVCYIEGNIVSCCEEFTPDYIVVDEYMNDYVPSGSVSGADILMFGDVYFLTGSFSFDATTIQLGPDAALIPDVGAELSFSTTDLLPFCNCRWDGIHIDDNSNYLSMDRSSITGALRGVNATDEASISLVQTDFVNNFISIRANGFNGVGPYNGSYLKVDGCEFDITANPWPLPGTLYCYDASLSRVNMNTYWQANCNPDLVIDVMVRQSDNVHVGHDSYSPNLFKHATSDDKTGVSIDGSQVFIRNSQFSESFTDICSHDQSKVIVGGTPAQATLHVGGNIDITESSLFFNNSYMYDVSFEFTNPWHTTVAPGYDAGSEIAESEINDSRDFLIDGNGNNSYMRIYDNEFYDSQVLLHNFDQQSNGRLIFHSNYSEMSTSDFAVEVDQCDGMTFANNHLENLMYYTPYSGTGLLYVGVRWDDSRDATVSNNYLENFSRGFHVQGNNTTNTGGIGTQFTCNEFVNCYYGFYFNSAAISNQGSGSKATDNCFNYYYAQAGYPYGPQIAGLVSPGSKSWYIRNPSSCTGIPPYTSCYCVQDQVSGLDIASTSATPNVCDVPSDKSAEIRGKDEKESVSRFDVYPNPAKDVVRIINTKGYENASIGIYNLMGKLVYSAELKQNSVEINISDFEGGLYLIKVGGKTRRLIIQ
ncbi:T9SS type A sorting domain-containing protein [Owenweeksia hongkongensis]|uniref:T9SS type A sorting domain-containing protein n=1 Tax=Owenweeksia hongkongensis TaxID=253245 RepID=UPI003A8FFC2B